MANHRTYELVMILDPSLETEQTETELRRYQDLIVQNGQARRWERWGKRRLAYEIRGKQYGFYALVVFDLVPAMLAELDRQVRLNTNIMRHLITVVEPARVPEIDAEAVRTLGATAVPSAPLDGETESVAAEGEAVVPADIVAESLDLDRESITE